MIKILSSLIWVALVILTYNKIIYHITTKEK
jgi:hypothetical protein